MNELTAFTLTALLTLVGAPLPATASLRYRRPGDAHWKRIEMTRRVRSVFAAEIPAKDLTSTGLEYYTAL